MASEFPSCTGNINKGPGAGAYNTGSFSGSINNNKGRITFKASSQERIPIDGSLNIGTGAGAHNAGSCSGSINGSDGPINFTVGI
ncbi:hypothetical protein SLE2022_159630 [Rubroshorea leprosula]